MHNKLIATSLDTKFKNNQEILEKLELMIQTAENLTGLDDDVN